MQLRAAAIGLGPLLDAGVAIRIAVGLAQAIAVLQAQREATRIKILAVGWCMRSRLAMRWAMLPPMRSTSASEAPSGCR